MFSVVLYTADSFLDGQMKSQWMDDVQTWSDCFNALHLCMFLMLHHGLINTITDLTDKSVQQ